MKEKTALEAIDRKTCVVKGTHTTKGRTSWVKPGDTASRNLFYGRVILSAGDAPVEFETAGHETGLICLNGSGNVTTGDRTFAMTRYDAIYIPRDSNVTVSSKGEFDLAEIASPVEKQYPLQFVSFADIRKNDALHFKAGAPPTERSPLRFHGRRQSPS
jgi:5-deoxy-glucuronate isomerase